MNIGIDIDDTLTNSFDYFMPFVAEYFGADLEFLKSNNISYSTLPIEWKKDELGFCKKYFDKVVVDTPFKADSLIYVPKLHERGHKIIIITGRTPKMYTDPYKTTKEELDKNGILYDKIICTLNKTEACLAENIDIFIDDILDNCQAVRSNGIRTLLYTGKGNINENTDLERVSSWQEIFNIILELEKQNEKI